MISDASGLRHPDMVRSAAARPRGAKCAAGVLGLVLTKWRLAPTHTGRNEALGWCVFDCNQALTLDSWNTSAWQRQHAPSAVLSERPQSGQFNKKQSWAEPQPGWQKAVPKNKNPQVGESYHKVQEPACGGPVRNPRDDQKIGWFRRASLAWWKQRTSPGPGHLPTGLRSKSEQKQKVQLAHPTGNPFTFMFLPEFTRTHPYTWRASTQAFCEALQSG